MLLALGVLMVTMLLGAAVFTAVQGDAALTRTDLNGKQAYAAAQAGVQSYLYQLNSNASNSAWWENCANDTAGQSPASPVSVPGSTTGETYSYQPVFANGATTCSVTNPVASLIDQNTGTLRIAFSGHSGTGGQAESRTVVASFRTLSPLSFLWYTKYETVDTSIDSTDNCARFYFQSPGPGSSCVINWVTGDHMNGPMYTQDQFYVASGNSPTFGRAGSNDQIASQVPSKTNSSEICASDNCSGATVDGSALTTTPNNAAPDVAPQVPLPADNANLLTDATNHGKVYTGTVTLTLTSDGKANGWDCTSATACTPIVGLALATNPIIYAQNVVGGACSAGYNPTSVGYSQSGTYPGAYYGPCGDIYVSGTYSTPLTIAAENDVIVTGNLVNSTDTNPGGTASPTGPATLGLVADQYVRVKHSSSSCQSGNPNVTIDAAILTLAHSFFVDNYTCGGTPLGTLTVHGAIAQNFRGIVGSVGASGYFKNYNYDDRLALILPPYLFDLQNTQWEVFRETLCSTGATTIASSCSAPS